MDVLKDRNFEFDLENFHFYFNQKYSAIAFLLSSVATVTNCVCINKIVNTFNIKQAVYSALLACAAMNAFAMAVTAIMSLAFLGFGNSLQSKNSCRIWTYPNNITFSMSQFFMCFISNMRYI